MSTASLVRRPLALAAAALLAASVLSLSPLFVGAAHASNASNADKVYTGLNQYRSDHAKSPLAQNGFLTRYAEQYATAIGKSSSHNTHQNPPGPLFGNPQDVTVLPARITGGSSSKRPGEAVKLIDGVNADSDYLLDNHNGTPVGWNYMGVGYYTKGSSSYIAVILAKFAGTPPEILSESAPTIAGSAKLGSVLTATPHVTPSNALLTYQWKAGGSPVGSSSSTYSPVFNDLGKKVTVTITASKSGFATVDATTTVSATSASTKAVVKGKITGAAPTVSGSRTVGSALFANVDEWFPGTVAHTFQWYRGSHKITVNGTSPGYTQVPADEGHKITVAVTGTELGFTSLTKKSAAKSKTAAGIIGLTFAPTITGSFVHGQTLTAAVFTWQPAPVTMSWQWKVDGKSVSKATQSTFVIPSSAVGKKVTVVATGKKTGYGTKSMTSAPTPTIG